MLSESPGGHLPIYVQVNKIWVLRASLSSGVVKWCNSLRALITSSAQPPAKPRERAAFLMVKRLSQVGILYVAVHSLSPSITSNERTVLGTHETRGSPNKLISGT